MIERPNYGGPICFHCDGCPEVIETELTDFGTALAMIRRSGWRVKQVCGEWIHMCRDCAPRLAQAARGRR